MRTAHRGRTRCRPKPLCGDAQHLEGPLIRATHDIRALVHGLHGDACRGGGPVDEEGHHSFRRRVDVHGRGGLQRSHLLTARLNLILSAGRSVLQRPSHKPEPDQAHGTAHGRPAVELGPTAHHARAVADPSETLVRYPACHRTGERLHGRSRVSPTASGTRTRWWLRFATTLCPLRGGACCGSSSVASMDAISRVDRLVVPCVGGDGAGHRPRTRSMPPAPRLRGSGATPAR